MVKNPKIRSWIRTPIAITTKIVHTLSCAKIQVRAKFHKVLRFMRYRVNKEKKQTQLKTILPSPLELIERYRAGAVLRECLPSLVERQRMQQVLLASGSSCRAVQIFISSVQRQ